MFNAYRRDGPPSSPHWDEGFIEQIWYDDWETIGIKVKIMRAFDPTGKLGPSTPLPDKIVIQEPKDDDKASEPHSVCKIVKAPEAPVAQAPPQQAGPQ